ncbi:MAG TPA: endo-1,4-beta-xylanase [Jiangellales bacterium]|nr:endo-1,4-beta-xylanase [Jiangellales bacterium]
MGSVAAVAVALAEDEPVVVLANDFEGGSFTPWQPRGGTTLAITNEAGHDSANSLSVTGRTANWNGVQTDAIALFDQGVTYTISAWVKLPAGTAGPVGINFAVNQPGDPTNEFPWVGGRINTTADTWVQIGGTYALPPGQATATLYIEASDATTSFLVDDVLITAPPSAPEVEILAENDFEDGSVAPWQGRGAASIAITNAEGRDSANSLAVTGRTATWNGVQTDAIALGFEQGVTYTISAWVKLPAGSTETVGINFGVNQPGDPTNEFPWVGGRINTTADAWVQIGGTYTLPTGQATATLYIEASTTSDFLVDDILVTGPGSGGPEPGVVLTTDFEDGLDGWVARESGAAAHMVAVSTEQAHGGAQSAEVSGRDNQGDGIGVDIAPITEPGVSYTLTAWARFAPDQETDELWLSLASTTGSSTAFATLARFTNVTNDGWNQVTASFNVPEADVSLLYFETRWQDNQTLNTSDFYVDDIVLEIPPPPVVQPLTPLQDTVDFPLGAAIDSRETTGSPSELLLRHYGQITPENHMKPDAWYDADRNFRPHSEAIAIMDFAEANDLRVYGHVLVWHSQVPPWFFQDAAGNPLTNSPEHQEQLRTTLQNHIDNVANWLATEYGQFGGGNPIVAFDVVNEVVSDASTDPGGLRQSDWYRILGEDFIDLAFQYAEQAFNVRNAAPGATNPVTLFINDYNTEQSGKQDRYRALIERLLARNVPVDGVGHQFHLSINTPISSLAAALNRFADLDLVQAVTELDVTVGTPVSPAAIIEQGYYYRDAFEVFRSHDATNDDLLAVTIWGLSDNRSWRSTQAPLPFDGGLQAKPAYYGIADPDELPALLRTANVFGGDVPLTGAPFDAVEWRQLPAHQLSNEAGSFGLRWVDDHLAVLATVASDTADTLEFEYAGSVVTFAKNNPGTAGVVNDDGPGWQAVVHLPHSGIAAGDTGTFDIRALGGGQVIGAWNSPGALGALSYLEPLSYLEVVEAGAAPSIDGAIDDLWSDATVVRTEKLVEGSTNAQADVRTLWLGDTLYVLFEVDDPVIDLTSGDPWQQDSVELFIDAGNAKNGPYRAQDAQMRINVDNVRSFGTGDAAAQAARLTSATSRTDTGYIVELAVTMMGTNAPGAFHGLDFQVNDGSPREGQATGARTAVHTWAEPTGTGFQTTARWGVGQLVGPAAPQVPDCTRTVSGLKLGNLNVDSGVTCLTSNALVIGKVIVAPGASLISDGGVLIGTITATDASWIDLRGGGSGPLTVSGTTAHLSVVDTVIAGGAQINNNTTPGPIVVSGNSVVGLLACSGNEPPPVNDGVKNRVIGNATGQCREL